MFFQWISVHCLYINFRKTIQIESDLQYRYFGIYVSQGIYSRPVCHRGNFFEYILKFSFTRDFEDL